MADVFFGVTDNVNDSQSEFCFSSPLGLENVEPLWEEPWQELNSLEENQVNSEKSPSHESDSGISSALSLESPEPVANDIFCDEIFSNNDNMAATEEWLENEMDFFSALLSSDEESNDKVEELIETLPIVRDLNKNIEKVNAHTSVQQVVEEKSGKKLPDINEKPSMTLRHRLPVRRPTLTTPVERKTISSTHGTRVAVRRPTLTTPVERKTISSTYGTRVQVLKVVTPVGSGEQVSPDVVIKAIEDKNRKNAEHAKVNREKKKTYMKGLENEVDSLKSSNKSLSKESASLKTERDALLDEVAYLKSVLANESSLSNLLKNIPTVKNIQLSSSFNSRKRSARQDHDYGVLATKSRRTAGICLHVDKDTVSLEFCSQCAEMATQCDEIDKA